ncbi:hypothetical protein Q4Q35_03870 [Flavivirga aquimarina]|uniref:Uncharacterized protein n=1 Tax=Flavivirga aquimarina TaxID=2027862 RepID=A0ABT8W744_9FLAO|nr:hypothetical protein [Flavivirga aquimarina]MDO5968935.1 hypothetical protein [Flavivirga aquimarina]
MFKNIKWSDLRVLGENKMINKSYIYLFIVPALAKILEKVKSPLNMVIFGEDIEIVFELPFTWQVFYFCSLFFTIAAVIYNLKAPSIIKENKSYASFVEEQKNFKHLDRYIGEFYGNTKYYNKLNWKKIVSFMEEGDKKKLDKELFLLFINKLNRFTNKYFHKHQLNNFKSTINFKNKDKNKNILYEINVVWFYIVYLHEKKNNKKGLENGFWMIYDLLNMSKSNYKKVSFFSYLLGIFLIAFVLIQNVWTVIKIMFNIQ